MLSYSLKNLTGKNEVDCKSCNKAYSAACQGCLASKILEGQKIIKRTSIEGKG